MTILFGFITLTILMIILGFPMFVSFGIGSLGMIIFLQLDPMFVVPCIFSNFNSFVMMAIPFFIFAGGLMAASEISKKIVEFANAIIGRFKGGLLLQPVFWQQRFPISSSCLLILSSTISIVAIKRISRSLKPCQIAIISIT